MLSRTQPSILQKRITRKRYQVTCLVGRTESDYQVWVLQRRREGQHPTSRLPCASQTPPGACSLQHQVDDDLYNLSVPNVQVNFGDLVCHHVDPSSVFWITTWIPRRVASSRRWGESQDEKAVLGCLPIVSKAPCLDSLPHPSCLDWDGDYVGYQEDGLQSWNHTSGHLENLLLRVLGERQSTEKVLEDWREPGDSQAGP